MQTQTKTRPAAAKKAICLFPQKLWAEVDGRRLGAALSSVADLPLTVAIPCPLHPDSVRYAACRAFVKSPSLRAWALQRSYDLRLSRRRRPGAFCFCAQLPVQLFALREGQAFVLFSVSAEQVCVEQVWLLPAGARPPRRVSVRLQVSGAPDVPGRPAALAG